MSFWDFSLFDQCSCLFVVALAVGGIMYMIRASIK